MADQIRSEALAAKWLASPDILDDITNNKPQEALKKMAADAVAQLQLPQPQPKTNDLIWLIIVLSFAIVLVGAAGALGMGVFFTTDKASAKITQPETMLTIFTTVVGFLAGLLSPSPVANKGGN